MPAVRSSPNGPGASRQRGGTSGLPISLRDLLERQVLEFLVGDEAFQLVVLVAEPFQFFGLVEVHVPVSDRQLWSVAVEIPSLRAISSPDAPSAVIRSAVWSLRTISSGECRLRRLVMMLSSPRRGDQDSNTTWHQIQGAFQSEAGAEFLIELAAELEPL